MKIIRLVWRDPTDSIQQEDIRPDEGWSVKTDNSWCRVVHQTDGIRRIVPSNRVCLIDFLDIEEKSNLITPKAFGAS